jgi:lactate 2-monooxygenase
MGESESAEREWPIAPEEWEAAAADALSVDAFDYVAAGAGLEWTMRANREAFERWRLRPQLLSGSASQDLSVEVLGTPSPAPFMLAPIAMLALVHADAELAVARACAATGIPMVVSTFGSCSMEAVAAELGETPGWFQLYFVRDRDLVASFVDRAAAAGYAAIVATLDTLERGLRDRDVRNADRVYLRRSGIAQFTSDPVFSSRLGARPEEDAEAVDDAVNSLYPNPGVSWDDVAWLCGRSSLPVLVKGVLGAEDALRARDAGAQGVIVSNHGGRQVDGAVAALDVLPEVREALGDTATVLMDSGIRRAPDMLKAVALGADATLLGRPYVYALAVAGQAGVEQILRFLINELSVTLSLIGASTARGVDRRFVAAPQPG